MLNEFDQYLDRCYLGKKVRKDRCNCNSSIKDKRPIASKEKGNGSLPFLIVAMLMIS
jgi:hypothetical protein